MIKPLQITFLRSRCVPLNKSCEPYLPLLEALEKYSTAQKRENIINLIEQHSPNWWRQLSGSSATAPGSNPKTNNIPVTSGKMLREGVELFEKVAKDSVFLLILDNAQWADDFTLDLINFLMFRCSPAKLLILISYRPDCGETAVYRLARMEEELSYRGKSDVMDINTKLPIACC